MANINSIIEEAQLMKQNRADIIKALNDVGFNQVDEHTTMAEIARYMQWAGGLLDVCLATFSKSTFQHRYWTYDEWMGASSQTRSQYIQMGVRLRAEGQEFIIAKSGQTSDTGTASMQWCTKQTAIRGLTQYSGNSAMLSDMDGENNTDIILSAAEDADFDCPAARRARAFQCCSIEEENIADPTKWSLPAIGQLWLCIKYQVAIDTVLEQLGMSKLNASGSYWTSTVMNQYYALTAAVTSGVISAPTMNSSSAVRPVAKVQPTESAAPQSL